MSIMHEWQQSKRTYLLMFLKPDNDFFCDLQSKIRELFNCTLTKGSAKL